MNWRGSMVLITTRGPCSKGHFSRGQPSTMDLKTDSHYVLSGGMGALGMVTAQYLLEEPLGRVKITFWASAFIIK